jgi:hypothetical protein
MNSSYLAKQIVDILTPYLQSLLSNDPFAWFYQPNSNHELRENAEKIWSDLAPLLKQEPRIYSLFQRYAQTSTNSDILNDLVSTLASALEKDYSKYPSIIKMFPSTTKSINIGGNAHNSTLIAGNNNSILTRNQVSIGNIQQVVVNRGGINYSAEIRDIWIDLKLIGGEYPTFCYYDSSGLYSILGEKSWWEPVGYSYDNLLKTLMSEINYWTKTGWEVIETDLDNLWRFDTGYSETPLSRVIGLALPFGLIYKHWKRYKGAIFHVRKFL